MDEERFGELYERHAAPLAAYLARVSGSREAATDLLQETFCRFYAADLPAMADGESKSYLYRIATNLLRDRWRRMRQPAAPAEDDRRAAAVDMDAVIDVRRALDAVSPRERELLWLAYVDGATHQEIASRTGLRAMSIRTLLLRARRKLIALLRGQI
jgi:RNA polymerase sigma-70 factor (ECF subfamily)